MFHPQRTTMELLPVVCLCLLTCSEITSADGHGPVVVEEGTDVILPCSVSTNIESKLFDWKKDVHKEVFMYDAGIHYNNGRTGQDEQFRGRVSHFQDELQRGNASIIIRDTKVKDSGDYSCVFPRLHPPQTFHIELHVGAAPKPTVTTLNQTEDGVLLQCVVQRASPKPKVQWRDSAGNNLTAKEPQVTDREDSYDTTLLITVSRADHYRCVATQEEIKHQIYAETYVPLNGEALKPSVKILGQTEDGILLQCEVNGASPQPKVEWQDSDGNILPAKDPQVSERGGSYDIILQTTVTKTDNYRCVATQEVINHQTEAETFVPVNGFSTGLIVGAVLGALLVGFVLGVLVLAGVKGYIPSKKGSNKKSKGEEDRLHPPNSQPE